MEKEKNCEEIDDLTFFSAVRDYDNASKLVHSQPSWNEGYTDLNFIDDNVSMILIDKIKDATDEDEILSLVRNYVTLSWPEEKLEMSLRLLYKKKIR